jgi:[DsrC]-trisulfide reductase subunit O
MSVDRRKFVKYAGLTALGLAAHPVANLLGQEAETHNEVINDSVNQPIGEALTAHRWAMVIDMRIAKNDHHCFDKAIAACHKVHNVPEMGLKKDEIKWAWTEEFHTVFHDQENHHFPKNMGHLPTMVLCNHCDNPSCVRVCPTGSTWKREDGIVMMDWHRCIGCRYCVVACPYGSRSFNFRDPRPYIKEIQPDYPTRMRGVVEKCTFCEERLAFGKMPACVEATDNGVITFGDLENPESDVSKLLAENFAIRRKPTAGTQPEVYYIV